MNDLDFDMWLQYGLQHKYCGPPVCAVHDGLPSTEAEDEEQWEGDEICLFVIRPYDSAETAAAVEKNHPPSVWRKPYERQHR